MTKARAFYLIREMSEVAVLTIGYDGKYTVIASWHGHRFKSSSVDLKNAVKTVHSKLFKAISDKNGPGR